MIHIDDIPIAVLNNLEGLGGYAVERWSEGGDSGRFESPEAFAWAHAWEDSTWIQHPDCEPAVAALCASDHAERWGAEAIERAGFDADAVGPVDVAYIGAQECFVAVVVEAIREASQ